MRYKKPGVNITIVDNTEIVQGEPTGTPAGVIGTAQRGPAFVPVRVGSLSDWTSKFGDPQGRPGPMAVAEWLRNASSATYLRTLGVGNAERRTEEGNVLEAGFIVGGSRTFPEATNESAYAFPDGEQVPGRSYFLGAYHKDKNGSKYIEEANPHPLALAYPLVRGVLMTPRGVVATLMSSSDFNPNPTSGPALAPDDVNSYGVDPYPIGNATPKLGGSPHGLLVRTEGLPYSESVLLLNGHIPTPSSPSRLLISFDPNASNYFAKVLNRDPEKLESCGHCLYAWWDIDPEKVEVTAEDLFDPEFNHVDGPDTISVSKGAFCLVGREYTGEGFSEDLVNYENFEERYSEPSTPWIISESTLTGSFNKLFRIHSFDSGASANEAYRVVVSNISRTPNEWTGFDVSIYRWSEKDIGNEAPLERFSNLNLNPDSENFISRRIGDKRLKYVWDANPANQGLQTEGNYDAVSSRVWVEVSPAVSNGLQVKDTVPVGYEGLPHLVLDGWRGLVHKTEEFTATTTGASATFSGEFPSRGDTYTLVLSIDGEQEETFTWTADSGEGIDDFLQEANTHFSANSPPSSGGVSIDTDHYGSIVLEFSVDTANPVTGSVTFSQMARSDDASSSIGVRYEQIEGLLFYDDSLLGASDKLIPPDPHTSPAQGHFSPSGSVYEAVLDVSHLVQDGDAFDYYVLSFEGSQDLPDVEYVWARPTTETIGDFATAAESFLRQNFFNLFGAVTVVYSAGGTPEITLTSPEDVDYPHVFVTPMNSLRKEIDYETLLLSSIRQPPVPFRENLLKTTGSSTSGSLDTSLTWGLRLNSWRTFNDTSLSQWGKYFPDFGHIPMWSRLSGVDAQSTYGSLMDVNEYNNNKFSLLNIEGEVLPSGQIATTKSGVRSLEYRRDGSLSARPGVRMLNINDFSDRTLRPYLKFSVPLVGGFDGVNIFHPDFARLTDAGIQIEKEEGIQGFVPDPHDISNPLVGPTWSSYAAAVELMSSVEDINVQIFATPGIRHESITNVACELASERLDSIFLLDPEIIGDDGEYLSDAREFNLTNTIQRWEARGIDTSYVAAYFPDVVLTDLSSGRRITVPPSVAAMGAFALNDSVGAPWLSAAGADRGALPPGSSTLVALSDRDESELVLASINPILHKGSLGPVVWGNRTTRRTESVLNRINVRRLLIEVRRRVMGVGLDRLFEQGTAAGLSEFQSRVQPILDDIQSKRGIRRGIVRIDTTTTTEMDFLNQTIKGIIIIQPERSYEYADASFELTNS